MNTALRGEIQLTVGAVVLFNVGLSFFAIGLFSRMAPAIDHILAENAVSIADTGLMLGTLALPESEATNTTLQAAFKRLQDNVTEPEEQAIVADIERALAQRHAKAERQTLVSSLQRLAEVNQQAMEAAGRDASRLGTAGAWVAVWLGLLSALLSLWVLSRLRQRLITPLEELGQVLHDFLAGNTKRRCHNGHASDEVRSILEKINIVLDRATQPKADPSADRLGRLALSKVIERVPQAVAITEYGGRIIGINQAMLDALAGPEGGQLRAALGSGDVPAPEGLAREPIVDAPGQLCTFAPEITANATGDEPSTT